AEYLHVLDGRMAVEEFLDLPRIDVLPTADHHVLDAPDNVAVAVFIHRRQIACVHPAATVDRLSGAFLIVPVAKHDGIAPGAEFAGHAARHDAPFRIDDL